MALSNLNIIRFVLWGYFNIAITLCTVHVIVRRRVFASEQCFSVNY